MPNCILIGSGPGVGEAIARRFGRQGYRVGLIARSAENLENQAVRLSALSVVADWAVADAGNLQELDCAIGQLVERMGVCDVLIYNAAVLQPANPLELTSAQLREEFSVNLMGAHLAAKIVAPGMIEKAAGTIIFTGGGLALEPFPEWASLALGKAALRSLSFSLFKELAPKGVHVCVIAICGIVAPRGQFDPDVIAGEYLRIATGTNGVREREVIFQPAGTDPLYNDPDRVHVATTVVPHHATAQK